MNYHQSVFMVVIIKKEKESDLIKPIWFEKLQKKIAEIENDDLS